MPVPTAPLRRRRAHLTGSALPQPYSCCYFRLYAFCQCRRQRFTLLF